MNINQGNLDNYQLVIDDQTLTTSGALPISIDTSQYKEINFSIRIDGPVSGTTPTIQFTLFDLDSFGISVTGNSTSTPIYTNAITAQSFTHFTQTGKLQFNWTITGTTPSFGGVYAAVTGLKDAIVIGQKTMANSSPVVIASNQTSIPISDNGGSITVDGTVAATQSGTWNINNISGTVSLPTGAATSANQTTANTSLSSIDSKTPVLISGRQPVDGSGVTQPISASSLPLPTGASTSVLQTTGNTSLSSINGKLNSLGQKTKAGSVPVTIASDQGSIAVSSVNTATTATVSTVSVTTSSTQILAANANRKGFIITNVGGNTVYVAFGFTPTTSLYSVSIQTSLGSDRYEPISCIYTGVVNAIRGSGSTNIVVVEFT